MRFTWDISFGSIVTGLPMLFMMAKMYGDWRVIKDRIDLMWIDYCRDHKIPTEKE